MFETRLNGSYYEMGLRYGTLLHQGGIKPEELTEQNQHRVQFANACEKIIQKYTPDIISYLEGIAEGMGYEYDRVKILPMILNYGWDQPPSCTICFVSSSKSATGAPLMFRNYDWDYEAENYFSLNHTSPTGQYRSISLSDVWCGAYGGLNEHGLLVAITAGASYKGDWKPGISMNLLVTWLLDHFQSAIQAAEFLESVLHMGAFHFFIADNDKNIARVLGTPEKVVVEHFHDENVVQTNHIIVESMKQFENPQKIPPSSPIRFKNVNDWLEDHDGSINPNAIKDFCKLSIPEGGIHEDDEFQGIKFGTIWSWYFDFATQSFYITPGNPKNHSYQKITI